MACTVELSVQGRFLRGRALAYLAAILIGGSASAASVQGASSGAMSPNGTIAQNAAEASNLTTLAKALKQTDLSDQLAAIGPFTVFAPSDAAFARLPSGTLSSLLGDTNKASLASVIAYHVVPGTLDAAALMRQVRQNGGEAAFKTLNGATLHVVASGKFLVLRDQAGNRAAIKKPDLGQANGVIHVIDGVLMPTPL